MAATLPGQSPLRPPGWRSCAILLSPDIDIARVKVFHLFCCFFVLLRGIRDEGAALASAVCRPPAAHEAAEHRVGLSKDAFCLLFSRCC